MKRFLAAIGSVMALVAAAGPPSIAQSGCGFAKGTVGVFPPTPAVNHRLFFRPNFGDSRTVIDGSERITVNGPTGSYTYNQAEKQYAPRQVGHYTVTATQQVVCDDPEYSVGTDSAGPQGFDVRSEKDGHATFTAFRKSSAPGSATLVMFVACPDSDVSSSTPQTFAVYYEFGSRLPTHASPHLSVAVPEGCNHRGPLEGKHRDDRRFWLTVDQGASIRINGPTAARVLLEMTSGGKVAGATRARFAGSSTGERVKPDTAPCVGAPHGCQRWRVHVTS